ncbi:hypothetical protein [Streptomyces europaeiscabiei]|uniref:hypothetical protein n=1 Tax=Streptomyces europaeiscabiei TaxID=146819 RepID=UPI002E0E7424|nr:hypothetical protein OHB30_08930 [Streptomyces europaeiscabiei]
MSDFGYFLSCEVPSPTELVEWNDRQGQSAVRLGGRFRPGVGTAQPSRFRRSGGGTEPVHGGAKVRGPDRVRGRGIRPVHVPRLCR